MQPPTPVVVKCNPEGGPQPDTYEDVVLTVSGAHLGCNLLRCIARGGGGWCMPRACVAAARSAAPPTAAHRICAPPPPAGKTTDELNAAPLNAAVTEVVSQIAGQCTQYINTTAVAASRRRSLLQGGSSKVTSRVAAADQAAVQTAVNAAFQDGTLAAKLQELGLTLEAVSFASGSNSVPVDSGGSSLSGGAIAGITIGAVAAAAAAGGALVYVAGKRKKGAAAEPAKTGDMFSTNPAFAEEVPSLVSCLLACLVVCGTAWACLLACLAVRGTVWACLHAGCRVCKGSCRVQPWPPPACPLASLSPAAAHLPSTLAAGGRRGARGQARQVSGHQRGESHVWD